ncbi:hypothetical protein Agub_g14517 [Astrephomene gubernaculifera]|uniref:Fucolectin tachylectin-4 pentraxin-1 domain-containing protein n=1 Tax=Astrephomene gubernaculifera TaxID=47775 RepID=A0AAD3HSY7_9CHLO|nr:hypothetical protein Agub_g14517 [Astrephomene gubernaculifera]
MLRRFGSSRDKSDMVGLLLLTLLVASLQAYLSDAANIALRKKTYASSIFSSSYNSSYAVDGAVSKTAAFFMSAGDVDTDPWFSVDLGGLANITSVSIYTRCDCCVNRTRNAELRIGNASITSREDNVNYNKMVANGIAPDRLCSPYSISMLTETIGRWVTFQNHNPDCTGIECALQIIELQVFGTVGKHVGTAGCCSGTLPGAAEPCMYI